MGTEFEVALVRTAKTPDLNGETASEAAVPSVIIHCEQCKGCGRCVVECTGGALAMSKRLNSHGYPTASVAFPDRCKKCGLCFYNCPEPGAVTVHRKKIR